MRKLKRETPRVTHSPRPPLKPHEQGNHIACSKPRQKSEEVMYPVHHQSLAQRPSSNCPIILLNKRVSKNSYQKRPASRESVPTSASQTQRAGHSNCASNTTPTTPTTYTPAQYPRESQSTAPLCRYCSHTAQEPRCRRSCTGLVGGTRTCSCRSRPLGTRK